MENKENQPAPNYLEEFDKAPLGSLVKLPISKIYPTDNNDGHLVMTDGPIEVYKEDGTNKLFVYDGNHRFFEKEAELIIKYGFQNRDREPIEVKKVKNDKPWG